MNEIEILMERLKATKKDIEDSIHYAWEGDGCTVCYAQGLHDALNMSAWLFDTIEEMYSKDQKEQKLTSKASASERQLELL